MVEVRKKMNAKTPFIYRDMVVPFVLLIMCFAAWGVAAYGLFDLVSETRVGIAS